jgi:hypothetical protein
MDDNRHGGNMDGDVVPKAEFHTAVRSPLGVTQGLREAYELLIVEGNLQPA